jgi:hypothetical protein
MSIAQEGGPTQTTSPHVVALLASGGFLLLAGALFATPFLLSSRAQENDVFLANLFLAPLISLLGSQIYIFALRRMGLSVMFLLTLLAVYLAALTSWFWFPPLSARGISAVAPILAAGAALLFIAGALVAGTHRQWNAWTQGMALALVTSSALAVVYSFFGGHYLAFGETSSSLPPYLNTVTLIATAAFAVLAYVLGWLWGRSR